MPKQRQDRSAKWQFLSRPGPGEGRGYGQVRYSSEGQDIRSLNEQKDRIRAVFEREQWELLGFVEEPELSASYDDLDYRPQFAKLLTEMAGRDCNVIVCDETSRWARSAEVGHKSLRLLRERRCWWETASDDWNINKPLTDGGAIMWAIAQGMNEDYSRKLSYHTSKGKVVKAKDGYSNGRPMYGYRVPEIRLPSGATTQSVRDIRRRIVYEPDPTYFHGLQMLGELASQGNPTLSYREIAEEMARRGAPRYFSTLRGDEHPWNASLVAHMLRREFPREFVRGGGMGTIRHPNGVLSEGLHVAAWPYDMWQSMTTNGALATRRPYRYKKGLVGSLHGLLMCRHCLQPMKYREDRSYAQTKRYGRQEYHAFYYYCTGALRRACAGGAGGRKSFVNEQVANGQFGSLLALLGRWDDESLAFLKDEYVRQERSDHSAEAYVAYEQQRRSLEERRERVHEMYEMGTIDRTKYVSRLEEIARLESGLVAPQIVNQGIAQLIRSVRQIDTIAAQWEALSLDSARRRKIAHALISQRGIFYDGLSQRIVGIRPLPDFYSAFQYTLAREGWTERDGVFWHESYELPAPYRYHSHYQRILDFLASSDNDRTVAEVSRHVGRTTAHMNRMLIRLLHAGYVTRVLLTEGTTRTYLYRSSNKPYQGEIMARVDRLTG